MMGMLDIEMIFMFLLKFSLDLPELAIFYSMTAGLKNLATM